MVSQTVILVDNNDKHLGYALKQICHKGQGKRHRAFVTLLFNSKNQVLLQKRKHRLFGGFWDFTAISHPLYVNGRDETYQQASDRALNKEMGINSVPIKNIGAFNYFARDGENCEKEYCAVLTGDWDGQYKQNKKKVYDAKWMDYGKFLKDINKNPDKYTPWAGEVAKLIVNRKSSIVNNNFPSDFKAELERFVREFSKYSKSFFSKKRALVQKYPKLIKKFYEELEDFGSGGKAIRPFLVYLGYKLGTRKDSPLQIMPVCMAIELIHSFLLIHDDIIDKSDTRRNKPTIHKRFELRADKHYGLSQGLVLGDTACLEAFGLITSADFDESIKNILQKKIVDVILETVYGEILDVEYSYKKPNVKDIWLMTELKTARYTFVGPLTIGAFLGGASKLKLSLIEAYALSCGKAFQLQDDILGVFGDEKVIGKSTFSDMRGGKNTLLFYKTRELTKGKELNDLERIWGNPKAGSADLKRVQQIMADSGAKSWCQQEMLGLVDRAKDYVNRITNDKKLQVILSECADFVVYREN